MLAVLVVEVLRLRFWPFADAKLFVVSRTLPTVRYTRKAEPINGFCSVLYLVAILWHLFSMDAQPKAEPSPFERMQALAARVMAVPKAEVDKREQKWREDRAEKKRAKRQG